MSAFADGGSDAMRAQNNLKEALDDLRVGFGKLLTEAAPLISFFADLLGFVTDLFDGIDKLDAKVEELGPTVYAAAVAHDEFVAALKDAKLRIDTFETYRFEERLRGVGDAAWQAEDGVRAMGSALLEAASPMFAAQKAAERLADTIVRIDEDGARSNEELLELAEATLEAQAAMDAFAADGITGEVDALAKALGIGKDAATLLLQQLGLLDGLHVSSTYSLIGTPNVRTGATGGGGGFLGSNHSGGMIPGPTGQTVPILAMAGERVVPAGQSSGGGGGSVQVFVAGSVVSERELVDAVRRGLRADRVRGGSLEL
jgi:murein DD-endopeptidase MepM/ murein hydrolase activator NlpD